MTKQKTRRSSTFRDRLSPELLEALRRVGGIHALAKGAGVSFPVIYDWLNGTHKPRGKTLERVERYLFDRTGVLLSFELNLEVQSDPPSAPIGRLRGHYQIEPSLIRSLDVQRALKTMRARGQSDLAEIIVQRYLMNMTLAEIGAERGVSYQAIEQREYKAREALRKLLRAHGEEPR
jgi:DNA-directed RNA polymerase specialized sigma24 family protein